MTKRLAALAATLILLLSVTAAAADSTPAIYRVTDGEGHFIYLMGTCHILTPDCLPIAGIDELLDGCGAIALEIEVAGEGIDTAAGDLLELSGNDLPPETRDRIADYLTSKGQAALIPLIPNLSANALILLVSTTLLIGDDFDGITSPEIYLNDLAEARGLPLIGLETVEDQTQAVTDGVLIYTDEEADVMLNGMLDSAPVYAEYISTLQRAWSTGDEETLRAVSAVEMAEGSKDAVTREVVITARNDTFRDSVAALLENGGGVFVAVGLMHVYDPQNGLLVRLADEGCTVERWHPAAAETPAETEAVPAE